MNICDFIRAKNGIFPESVLFGMKISNLIEPNEEIVGSDLRVGIVLEIVADNKLRDGIEFRFGVNVGRGYVMERPESLLIGIGDISDIEIGVRVGQEIGSDFL